MAAFPSALSIYGRSVGRLVVSWPHHMSHRRLLASISAGVYFDSMVDILAIVSIYTSSSGDESFLSASRMIKLWVKFLAASFILLGIFSMILSPFSSALSPCHDYIITSMMADVNYFNHFLLSIKSGR